MICPFCKEGKHQKCTNLWTIRKGKLVKRDIPTSTHCFCQHRKNAKFITSESENGDGS